MRYPTYQELYGGGQSLGSLYQQQQPPEQQQQQQQQQMSPMDAYSKYQQFAPESMGGSAAPAAAPEVASASSSASASTGAGSGIGGGASAGGSIGGGASSAAGGASSAAGGASSQGGAMASGGPWALLAAAIAAKSKYDVKEGTIDSQKDYFTKPNQSIRKVMSADEEKLNSKVDGLGDFAAMPNRFISGDWSEGFKDMEDQAKAPIKWLKDLF